MENFILEACVDSVESAIAAQKGGANRLELCANLVIGGTTPDIHLYHEIRRYTTLPINVLIRPRFGDFCYSEFEYEIIKEDIHMFVDDGADGIVCGFLNPDGSIDMRRMQESIALCSNRNFTFHRAFDVCADPLTACEQAKNLGVTTILTSGQRNTALEGKELIHTLVQNSGNMEILVGSGVNAKTLPELIKATGAKSYHMSAKKEKNSAMVYRKSGVTMGLPIMSEYLIWETDSNEIAVSRKILENA